MGKVTDRTPGVDSENNTSTLIIGYKAGAAFTPVYEATTMATSLIQGYGTVSWNVYGAETNRLYASIAQLGDSYLINDCDESLIIRLEYPPQKIDVISNGAIYYFDYIRDDITEDWLVQFECTDDDRVKDITDAYNAIYRYTPIPLDGSASQSILNITWKEGALNTSGRIIANFPANTEWENLISIKWQWTTDSPTATNRIWTTIPADVNTNIIASTDIYIRLVGVWRMYDVSIVDKPVSANINNLPVENAYSMSDREYNNYVKVSLYTFNKIYKRRRILL
jgi:hypothetical protein